MLVLVSVHAMFIIRSYIALHQVLRSGAYLSSIMCDRLNHITDSLHAMLVTWLRQADIVLHKVLMGAALGVAQCMTV